MTPLLGTLARLVACGSMSLIMLVEPDPTTRALINAQLVEAGHQVLTPDTLTDALADLALLHPDLLILDSVGLPLDQVHQLANARRQTRLLLCTGAFDRRRLDLDALQPARVLTRPFSIGDLALAAETLLTQPWPPPLV
jgi:DNA-binding response OmpR family regulator